ncbi:MAG: hypothetical protein JSR69_11810 [Proteobacteria bacterium]|nr:hypothetical protein [Pseudomonadota bacterium]
MRKPPCPSIRPKPPKVLTQEKRNVPKYLSRFWTAINSPVSLLLISSVLVSGVGWLYQRNEAEQKEEVTHDAFETYATAEIGHRYWLILEYAKSRKTISRQDLIAMRRVFEGEKPYRPIVRDFSEMSVVAILHKLNVENQRGQGPLDHMLIEGSRQLSGAFYYVESATDLTDDQVREIGAEIVGNARKIKLLSLKW